MSVFSRKFVPPRVFNEAPVSHPAPPTTYDSAARPSRMVEELLDLVRYRDLLVQLVVNNLKTRYKRSFLGVAWTLLNPLVTMAVTTVAFSGVKSSMGGVLCGV